MTVLMILAAGLVLLVLLGLLGGRGQPLDVAVLQAMSGWRAEHGWVEAPMIALTHLGSGLFLLSLTGLAAAWLLWRRRAREAATLLLLVVGGRLGIELLKWAIYRPRPAFEEHPVFVFSQSFPSGHAANSMITYLALALIVVPERWRRMSVAAAVTLAGAIGTTRPLLGVHWPSDVLAGWTYGLMLVLAATLVSRARSAA